MAIDLREGIKREPRELYEAYEGWSKEFIPDLMPKLKADNRIPASVATVMERRLNSSNPWWGHYVDTGDMIAYSPNGNIKVVLDSQLIRELTPKTKLHNGSLVLEEGVYESLEGMEFKRSELILDRDLKRKEVRAHPIWKLIARDERLLRDYTYRVFDYLTGYGNRAAMRINLARQKKYAHTIPIRICSIESSWLWNRRGPDDYNVVVVGVDLDKSRQ